MNKITPIPFNRFKDLTTEYGSQGLIENGEVAFCSTEMILYDKTIQTKTYMFESYGSWGNLEILNDMRNIEDFAREIGIEINISFIPGFQVFRNKDCIWRSYTLGLWSKYNVRVLSRN